MLGQGQGMKLKNISKIPFHKSPPGILTKLAYHRQGIGSTFRRHDSFENLKGVIYVWLGNLGNQNHQSNLTVQTGVPSLKLPMNEFGELS